LCFWLFATKWQVNWLSALKNNKIKKNLTALPRRGGIEITFVSDKRNAIFTDE